MAAESEAPWKEVYLLPLTDDGAPDVQGQYIYLPPPKDLAYIIRFEIEGTSSICREGSLWSNIPAPGKQFDRERYREYKSVTFCLRRQLI